MSESVFLNMGGEFNLPVDQLKENLKHIKAIIFDWDGVFNNGQKGTIPSNFSEIDSMGVNMLRFGYYLLSEHIPVSIIVTGETNETAFKWAQREHLDAVYFQVKNKFEMIRVLHEEYNIQAKEILFVFDDILDLSLAKEAGVRFLVRHKANPLFADYCLTNHFCDYITGNSGSENAIREISELTLDCIDKFQETIEKRIVFNEEYKSYLKKRNDIATQILKSTKEGFKSADHLSQ